MCERESEEPDDDRNELIDQMIRAGGAQPNDQVIIAGTQLDLLLGLLRRGFAGVTSAARRGPIGGDNADLLLIPIANSPEQLQNLLPRLIRCLRPGGTAVLYKPEGGSAQLRRMLQDLGLATLGERNCADGVLLTARKPETIRLGQVA
jgi:hypothetical protein